MDTIYSHKTWDTQEDKFMMLYYANTLTKDIAKKINRSIDAVYKRADVLGLRKSNTFLESSKSGRFDTATAVAYNNKFKKGYIPPNTINVGGIKLVSSNGKYYKYIKLSTSYWMPLSHYNWEKINGKIPNENIILFKDKDTMNCEVSNLECISKKENMARNTISNYPSELLPIIHLNKQIKKQLKNYEHNT